MHLSKGPLMLFSCLRSVQRGLWADCAIKMFTMQVFRLFQPLKDQKIDYRNIKCQIYIPTYHFVPLGHEQLVVKQKRFKLLAKTGNLLEVSDCNCSAMS